MIEFTDLNNKKFNKWFLLIPIFYLSVSKELHKRLLLWVCPLSYKFTQQLIIM